MSLPDCCTSENLKRVSAWPGAKQLKAKRYPSRKIPLRAGAYQKLHEFNFHIEQGIAALGELAQVKQVSTKEVRCLADTFEEFRADASEYLGSVFSGHEERLAGRLFKKRRRRERAED
jgi:hypothetical protein